MLFDIKSKQSCYLTLNPNSQSLALNVMAIRDRRHANKSKQTMSLVGFDVDPPIGVASRPLDHWEMKNMKKVTFI